MSELLPCPFCGGKAVLCTNDEGDKYGDGYFVWCCECAAESGCSSTDKEAIEAWNRVSDAVERMKPKRVVCRHFNKYYGNEIGDCPNCLCTIEDESELNEHPHCKYCGQALDWSE